VVFDDAAEAPPMDQTSGDQQLLRQVLKLQTELDAVHEQLAALSNQPPRQSPPGAAPQPEAALGALVEELDGAREELQAVNEELISVNHENQSRIETLIGLSNDLHNLLDTTAFATVLLNRDLQIMRFTPGSRRAAAPEAQ
jgi:two-component system CheB/CheR fusion protein